MTYKMDEDALLRKVDCSELDEELKGIFRNTIRELCAYNKNQLESIEKKILFPADPQSIGEIAIALMPRRDKRDKPYFGLMEIDGVSNDVYFLNAEYARVQEFVGDLDTEKVYTGTYWLGDKEISFRYRLRFDGRYLKAQELLFRLASLYKMENAVLWSPFLRKAVSVQPVDKIPENVKKEQIDYRFDYNELPVMEHSDLLWNLQVTSTELSKAAGRIPYGQDVKYKYHFEKSKTGGWRFPVPKNNQTIVYDVSFSDEGIDLMLDRELEEFWVVEPRTVHQDTGEIMQLKQENRFHSNHIEKNVLSIRRILSQGDMEFAIRPFRNANGVRCELTDQLTKVCTRYSAKYQSRQKKRIWYPQSQHKKAKGMLKFSAEGSPSFYDDYINFVLLYLEYYYPEIEWTGGW